LEQDAVESFLQLFVDLFDFNLFKSTDQKVKVKVEEKKPKPPAVKSIKPQEKQEIENLVDAATLMTFF
jgi:hypothetical protein